MEFNLIQSIGSYLFGKSADTVIKNLKNYLNGKDVQLDILLDIICQRLQLDNTREKKLQSAYTHITDCIKKDIFFDKHDARMYAFGSRALNTLVKPFKRKEYDLDFAVQIILSHFDFTPKEFMQKLYACLSNDETFNGKLEPIRYGVRVVYANEFHVDIMLGVLVDSERLQVPDWKDNIWVNRNPKGYIGWFESKYIADYTDIRLYEYYRHYYPNMLSKQIIVEARSESEEIIPAVIYPEIQPIQRITQLIKRHRDIYFLKNMQKFKTNSIILTTLVGDNYSNETSIYDGMNGFIKKNMSLFELHPLIPFRLINPADRHLPESHQENLTDKWEKEKKYYLAFREYIRKLGADWLELHSKSSIRESAGFLQTIFGENIVKAAYESLNENYKNRGLAYDSQALPNLKKSAIAPDQVALAAVSRNRKPYYVR